MSEKSMAEKMGLTYHWEGDYLIPDLVAPEQPEEDLTKYGRMHMKWLKEHHNCLYQAYIGNGTIKERCIEVQHRAEDMATRIEESMMKAEGVTEELKAEDQMEWVRRMNSIRNRVDEVVMQEVVYCL